MASMRVEYRFSDDTSFVAEVRSGETLLEAAEREAIPVRSQCKSGSCSTCIARVVEGAVEQLSGIAAALLPNEVEAGCRLSCISIPNKPSVIAFDYPSTAPEPLSWRFNMLVDAIEPVAADVVKLKARAPKKLDFAFEPGQYLKMLVPGTEEWRFFSMSTEPEKLNRLEFLIRLLPDGVMSNYLRDRAKPGDMIEVDGPKGDFYFRAPAKKIVMIGGGTGVAPLLSMIRHLVISSARRPEVLLSAGFNSPEQSLFDEVMDVARWLPELETRFSLLSGSLPSGNSLSGNPVEAIDATDVEGDNVVAYLCGPPPMVIAAREHLTNLGLSRDAIFFENFTPSE